MSALLLLAAMPLLSWPHPLETAPALRRVGIERLLVPPERLAAWRQAGFEAAPFGARERGARVRLRPPGIVARADVASATQRPWITANGWRFLRRPGERYLYERLPSSKAALAMAEAFAHGVDAVVEVDRADPEQLGPMLTFLAAVPALALPGIADIEVVDDGSPLVGEILNLLCRRNLLFETVRAPGRDAPLSVRLGTREYPRKEAANPDALALKIRGQLTDERRSLRLYGSEVVLARLTGDATRVRLHLINYGGGTLEGLRVRLRGAWARGEAFVAGWGQLALEDYAVGEGATEFSLATLGVYAVVDLTAVPQ